jgi:hypothetical protein
MKKIIILIVVAVFCYSCASTNIVKEKEVKLKGDWFLTDITASKTGEYNITFFNNVSEYCLEGSTWKFVTNNYTGSYAINKTSCDNSINEFIFTVQAVDESQKVFDLLMKPKENNDANVGYRYSLKILDENKMQLQKKVVVDGVPFLMNLNFNRL